MPKNKHEDELLNPVAQQNAESLAAARERAEQELGEAREALDRKVAELHQQREWFRVTLSSIGDAVITTDIHGRINFLNPVAETMTGWKFADAMGKDLTAVFNIINEETRRPAAHPVRRVLREGKVVALANHTVLISRTGQEIAIEDSAGPIRDVAGQVIGTVMVFHDITERRKAEDEKKLTYELRARLGAVVDSADDAIITKTLQGIITSWNNSAERIFGYSADEVIGKPVTILMPPERVNEEPGILDRLKRGERVDHYETVRRRKDGTLLDISLTVSPVRDAKGNVVGASKIARDITPQKQAANELREARERLSRHAENLEGQVRERTAALRQTLNELETFSYSISHDLRAPLRAMQSFSLILAEECGPQIGPQGQEYIRRITTAAERMDRLIQDVLNYSRVARSELLIARVEPEKLLREILDSYPGFQPSAADIELKGTFPAVMANQAVLTQCFSNLLGNAVKFVAPGVRPHVEISSEVVAEGKRVWTLFKDNGIGIEPAAQARIFGIFERVSNRYEGTGIGLAIVKKGVERMGGSVSVESKPGHGSTFCLELDAARNGAP